MIRSGIACMCALAASSLYAATWYVDKQRPDDAGNGQSEATAKRTIQAAVNASSANDTIIVLPGMYDEGEIFYASASNRVAVTKAITLKSRDGAATTHIVGRFDPTETDGMGTNAVRCIYLINGSRLEGFTLRNGGSRKDNNKADLESNRAGGAFCGGSSTIIADCILSNNVATRGGAAVNGALYRCVMANNRASNNGSATRDSRIYDSLLYRNKRSLGTGSSVVAYAPVAINCTFTENEDLLDSSSAMLNCIFVNNTATGTGSAGFTNCLAEFTLPGTNNIKTSNLQLVNPAYNDFRLIATAEAVDAANIALRALIPVASTNDVYGNPRTNSRGLISLGAVEATQSILGAVTLKKPTEGQFFLGTIPITNTTYVTYATWPTQFVFTASATQAGRALRAFVINNTWMPPRLGDNHFYLTPPNGSTTVVDTAFGALKYVDAVNGSDDTGDGTQAKPYQSLQKAHDAVTTSDIIVALPGRYDRGSTWNASHSNRLSFTRGISMIAAEGPEKTFIIGADAPISPSGDGRGTNAVRCLYITSGFLQGFTLTGGRSSYTVSDSDGDPIRGGATYGGGALWDCVISNNVASRGGATWNTGLYRCHILKNIASNNGVTRACLISDCVVEQNYSPNTVVGTGTLAFNSTIVSNTSTFATMSSTSDSAAINCLIYTNSPYDSDGGVRATNTLIGTSRGGISGLNVLRVDPLLCNVAQHDYRVLNTSPALGYANLNLMRFSSVDFYGVPRTYLNAMTLGAIQTPVGTLLASATGGGTIMPEGIFARTNETTLTFTATPAEGRRFLRFEVNGLAQSTLSNTLALAISTNMPYAQHTVQAVFVDGYYVDGVNGDDTNSGETEDQPFKTIQKAISLAMDGDIVRVKPGIYAETPQVIPNAGQSSLARLVVTNNITVQATDGAEKTIILGARDPETPHGCGSNAVRCVWMSQGKLIGFTLTGGATAMQGNADGCGGGFAALSTTYTPQAIACVISNNVAWVTGGASHWGTIHRTLIADNSAVLRSVVYSAAGPHSARIYDSVIINNTNGLYAASYLDAYNVTVVNPLPIFSGTYVNSIVVNTDPTGIFFRTDGAASQFSYCCLSGSIPAANNSGNNLYVDPLILAPEHNDFRLHTLSACINSGNTAAGQTARTGLDFYGNSRVSGGVIDRGASEGGVTTTLLRTRVTGIGSITPASYTSDQAISTNVTAIERPGYRLIQFVVNNTVTQTLSQTYSVSIPAGSAASVVAQFVTNATYYVDAVNGNDLNDGGSWAQAKQTLQPLVAQCVDNDTVIAAPGIYDQGSGLQAAGTGPEANPLIRARVVITNNITLRSRDGAAVTLIKGEADTTPDNVQGCGSNAMRCVYMRDTGTLQGFTLFEGRTGRENTEDCNNRGGGIYSLADVYNARVISCIISNNVSIRGGGAHSGTFENCLFTGNTALNNSSALRNGIAKQCYFTRNLGNQVIGFPNLLLNCTIAYNEAPTAIWGGSVPTPYQVYNTIIDGKIDGAYLNNCAYPPTIQLNNTPSTNAFIGAILLDANGVPMYGSVAVDNANTNLYASYPATDLSGGQRIYNAKLDIGCFESDWRPRYATIMEGLGIHVTAASSGVIETNNAAFSHGSAVYLPRNTVLDLTWIKSYSQSYVARYAVTGTGSLAVYRDNVLIDTATQASGWVKNKFVVTTNAFAMRFVYTPGANDLGGALLDGFAVGSSTLILVK